MTLKKINNFAETREAGAFAQAIEARAEGAKLFAAAPVQARFNAPKHSVA